MKKIAVITGAGISAESGIATYEDPEGIWELNSYNQVASAKGWKDNRAKVLAFWNEIRKIVLRSQPNAAHFALAQLEQYFHVNIITQNVDDLHERAGSTHVLHLHGEVTKARSSLDRKLIYDLDGKDILLGERCEKNSQLRPHVVWFGEYVPLFSQARDIVKAADMMLVIGCALDVYPAADLVIKLKRDIPIYTINTSVEAEDEFNLRQKATVGVVNLVNDLIQTRQGDIGSPQV